MYSAQAFRNVAVTACAIVLAATLCLALDVAPASAAETGGATASAVKAKKAAPAAPTVKMVKRGITSIQFGISQRGKVYGYQVAYHQKSGKWKFRSTKQKAFRLKNLGINHDYYVKVRAFKLVNGKRVYGAYSRKLHVFNGVEPLKSSEITQIRYRSFVHGAKKAGQQRYIMLHDTEGGGGPADVAHGWASDNNGTVAAHFVVGRDGKVVQTAKMNCILHHAGWGGRGDYGNYDAKFGVGSNNGKGTGDDLRGQVPWAGYTSYGMNSYSIGIEMCHVGGQDYPAAQLRAVDRLIAAIDRTYGGYAGKIIDHKTWRPGNSDTDANFAKYLKNYQKYRKHAK